MTSALKDVNELYGKRLSARDGDLGHVKDFYFDDEAWTIRYVVVDTGMWLTGRLVLLAPHAFQDLDLRDNALRVALDKKQIQDSPSISSHEPVSRQFEELYYRSYGWPAYWQGGLMWGVSEFPLAAFPESNNTAVRKALEPVADSHLQSAKAVTGYHVDCSDGPIGHVAGFRVSPWNWAIEEIVVKTGHWYAGREIRVTPDQVLKICVEDKSLVLNLSKTDLQAATSIGTG